MYICKIVKIYIALIFYNQRKMKKRSKTKFHPEIYLSIHRENRVQVKL